MSAAHEVLFDAPGPRALARQRVLAVVVSVLALAIGIFVLLKLGAKGNLESGKWTIFLTDRELWTEYLLPGIRATLVGAGLSIITAGIFGTLMGMGRLSPVRPIRWACGVLVEFFRSVPVLIMMIFAFALFSTYGLLPSDYMALGGVVVGLTFYNGAVLAELIRSGVHSLPKGQREAGLAIGLTEGQTLRSIELPQALTAMLPSVIAQVVVVLKDTAIGYIITYPELLKMGSDQLGTAYAIVVPAFMVVAVLYIAINYSISKLAEFLERRLRKQGHVAAVLDVDPTDQAA